MDIAKDGTITSLVDDIPGLSFRREERGCAKGGGDTISEMDRQAQQRSTGEE